MQRARLGRVRVALIATAVVLSVVAGLLSWLSQMVFSDHESLTVWTGAYLPSVLWILALLAGRFPRAGLAAYLIITVAIIGLQVPPRYWTHSGWTPWVRSAESAVFALVAGLCLLLNLVLLSRSNFQHDDSR